MSQPILITGAGPVGLTLAAALTHHGVPCRIIDKAPLPSDKSKALAVWCRTLELLDGLDLAEIFVRSGRKLAGGSMYANGERLVHLNLTSDESPYGFPLMIPQSITEQLLTEYLARHGVNVERQVELLAFTESPNSVQCTLRYADGREEQFHTPWLVGCDGAHSTVRHTLGLEFTGHAEPNDWILADVKIDGPLARDEVSVFWHDQGVAAFFPFAQDRVRIVFDIGTASANTTHPELTLAEVQATTDQRVPLGLKLSDPVWLAYFRIHERKVSEYRRGRAILAGDAAHIHSPAGGQGMNTGMQDAFNLAWKLALIEQGRGKADPLLESYSIERSAVGDQVLKNAERFTTIATLRSPIARWVRNHVAPILGSFDFVQDKIRNEWLELSVNYRHSPLSDEPRPEHGGGLTPGDRLCDAPLVALSDSRKSTLFDTIRGTRHTLLLLPVLPEPKSLAKLQQIATTIEQAFPNLFSTHIILQSSSAPPKPTTAADPLWLDSTNRLHEKLHATAPLLLIIRPDGYIGVRCEPLEADELLEFLKTYLIPS